MTSLDLEDLKRIAEAATQGEWIAEGVENEGSYGGGGEDHEGFTSYGIYAGGHCIFDTLNSDAILINEEFSGDDRGDYHSAWDDVGRRNSEFVTTFDPPTILSILTAYQEAVGRVAELEDVLFLIGNRVRQGLDGSPYAATRVTNYVVEMVDSALLPPVGGGDEASPHPSDGQAVRS
jgi:hypothetical protein